MLEASSMYGISFESTTERGGGEGANASNTVTSATAMTTPRTNPKPAPNNRSSHDRPIHLKSLASNWPTIGPDQHDTDENDEEPNQVGDRAGADVIQHISRRDPVTPEAQEDAEYGGDKAYPDARESSREARENRESDYQHQQNVDPVHSGFPVSTRYASRYFSLVLRTTSAGSAGAGGCLFQWMDSR